MDGKSRKSGKQVGSLKAKSLGAKHAPDVRGGGTFKALPGRVKWSNITLK
jgi:hypothetical protein